MANDELTPNLPAGFENAFTGIVHGLIPSSIKAVNRLIGAGIDIPAAYLERLAARARAKTASYVAVEGAVAVAVKQGVAADPAIAQRAMGNLLAKEYRKQVNREVIAREFMEELKKGEGQAHQPNEPHAELDDDWLNVFERFAEDATTERMQKLWGRVLAGEVRKPGSYSMRALRFLSEFSQDDALLFADYCESSFGGVAPNSLVRPDQNSDITALLKLEAAGLITGVSGMGLNRRLGVMNGRAYLVEGALAIEFAVTGEETIEITGSLLTPLGEELRSLLPNRTQLVVARKVAHAARQPRVTRAQLAHVVNNLATPFEVVWSQ